MDYGILVGELEGDCDTWELIHRLSFELSKLSCQLRQYYPFGKGGVKHVATPSVTEQRCWGRGVVCVHNNTIKTQEGMKYSRRENNIFSSGIHLPFSQFSNCNE
jgi:hypothetical protein